MVSEQNGFEDFISSKEKNVFNSIFGVIYSSDSSENEEQEHENVGPILAHDEINEINTNYTSTLSGLEVSLIERKELGIAHQVWPAARLLCEYLENNLELLLPRSNDNSPHVNIIELGSGVGLCGIFLSLLFGTNHQHLSTHIVITDLPEALPGMVENIRLNNVETYSNVKLEALELCWGNIDQFEFCISKFNSCPVVLAADCIYWTSLFIPFLKTVDAFCKKGAIVLIAHVKRWKKDSIFFSMCKKKGLSVEILSQKIEFLPEEHTNITRKQISRLYRISKQ